MRTVSHVLLCAVLTTACRSQRAPGDAGAGADSAQSALPPPVAPTPLPDLAVDLLAPSPRCRIEHRGAFVDLGTPEAAWAAPGHPDLQDLPSFERDGATWGRVLDRSQTFTVAIDQTGAALVSLRGRARSSKKVTISIDGKLVGTIALSTTEDRVVTTSNTSLSLVPGLHVVTLRWIGGKKDEPLAELDWLRVGVVDDETGAYAAPTRRDAVTQVVIGGAPRRAYTLMAPAVVRCVVHVPPGARLLADVGSVSEGTSGEVEIRERSTGSEPPTVLAKQLASATAWSGIAVPLGVGGPNGAIAIIELAVTKGPKQGRVAIAEPRIVRAAPPAPHPAAPKPESIIVIVLAGATPAHLALPSLAKLAREGASFRGHRAPSHLAAASVASLATGLPVPVHALEDSGARLSPRIALLPRSFGAFGVQSAMFTEVPTTGPAFGFAHDWTSYAARSPLDGPPVALDEIGKWLGTQTGKKTFILAHARGAHPPYDVTGETLKALPPEGYTGSIDPRHVVPVLAKVRKGLLKFSEGDRTRLLALEAAALAKQDEKLDALIESLRASGALDKTMIVVTGDTPFPIPSATFDAKAAASASASALPMSPPSPEKPDKPDKPEDPLGIPLIVRFAGGYAAGRVISAVTDPTDVATTIVIAWGGAVEGLAGRDLAFLAFEDDLARDTPRLSDDGHGYQLAWSDLRLVGAWGKVPRLELRGTADDIRAKRPHEYLAAWGLAAEARALWLAARAKGPGREPATIDPQTQAALDSWERSR